MTQEFRTSNAGICSRSPVYGEDTVSTSHPLASLAAMRIYEEGGNAVDAAIAAAMTLTVIEPTGCGIGSDAFAIVWDGEELHGLDASGRSPAGWTEERFAHLGEMPQHGWESITVPGAVSAWSALNQRFCKLPLDQLARPAIHYAREGYLVTPQIARLWGTGGRQLAGQPGFSDCFLPGGRAPVAGERFRSEAHARSLEIISRTGGAGFYTGELAERIVAEAQKHGAALNRDDLAGHSPEWVTPIEQSFQDIIAYELPPAGQGIATLQALGMLDIIGCDLSCPEDPHAVHHAIEAMKLALADLYHFVADRDHLSQSTDALLSREYLMARAAQVDAARAGDPGHGRPQPGGTVCLSTGDRQGMMVSFIQSNYQGFGSGIVIPGTGISLQNRGAGFSTDHTHVNCVGPAKRPFHTIIPGFAMSADRQPLLAYGVMGGPMQAQGHLQMIIRLIAGKQCPQAAADAPRWRILEGKRIAIENGMSPSLKAGLSAKGHDLFEDPLESHFAFGGAQIVRRLPDGYVAGSDRRKDGLALAR